MANRSNGLAPVCDAPPQRLRLSRRRASDLLPEAPVSPDGRPVITVALPARLGNPFIIGFHGDAAWCVALYHALLNHGPVAVPPPPVRPFDTKPMTAGAWVEKQKVHRLAALESLGALRGKHLACWCALDDLCHADALLALALEGETAAAMLARCKQDMKCEAANNRLIERSKPPRPVVAAPAVKRKEPNGRSAGGGPPELLFDSVVAVLHEDPGLWHSASELASRIFADHADGDPRFGANPVIYAMAKYRTAFLDMGGVRSRQGGYRIGRHPDRLVDAMQTRTQQIIIAHLRQGDATMARIAAATGTKTAGISNIISKLRRVVEPLGARIMRSGTGVTRVYAVVDAPAQAAAKPTSKTGDCDE